MKDKNGNSVEIINTVADDWQRLAYALRFNEQKDRMLKIHASSERESCKKMFNEWLQGKYAKRPKPATWGSLIKCLVETERFNDLANNVKEFILS